MYTIVTEAPTTIRVCLIDYQILKTAGLAGLEGLPEPYAPTRGRFDTPWRDSRFHLRNSENEAIMAALLQ